MLDIRGKLQYQEHFEKMLVDAIIGMNIGGGCDPNHNGEKIALEYIKRNLIDNDKKITIFDVGANIGDYTKMVIDVFKENTIVHSFEPSLKTFNCLKCNLGDTAFLHNIGFSDKIEDSILYTDRDLSGMASLYKRELSHLSIDMSQTETIKLDTIDNFCKNNNIDDISFLKMDVEGNEIKVLNGAVEMISKIKFIQFEFGGCNIDSRTYFQDFWYLLKDHYKIYRIVVDGLYEIKKYKEIYEIFSMTNFLAEKR